MQFFIYRNGDRFVLSDDNGNTVEGLASEGHASGIAVEIAQERDVLYSISYWRP